MVRGEIAILAIDQRKNYTFTISQNMYAFFVGET